MPGARGARFLQGVLPPELPPPDDPPVLLGVAAAGAAVVVVVEGALELVDVEAADPPDEVPSFLVEL